MPNDSNSNHEHDTTHDTHSDEPRIRVDIERGIFPLAVLAYLILGFVFGLWHPGWVVFIFAWLLGEIVKYFKTGKMKFSIYNQPYGVAAIIFLILGFGFGMWRHSWLVFVAAWVVDEMIISPSRKQKKKRKKEERKKSKNEGEN